jgi:hypothetical protein
MQLHLYVSDETGDSVRRHAEARGMSVSKFLADLVQREVGGGWPEGFFDRVIGGWQGAPLERPPQGELEKREDL